MKSPNFMVDLLNLILFLGMTGGLVDLTRSMMKKSADAHQMGLVNLTKLNCQLQGCSKKDHPMKHK